MAIDHALLVRIYMGALGLGSLAWMIQMLVTGRARDRWWRRVTESENPIQFALIVLGVAIAATIGLLKAAGFI
jgi:hypothetical protein